MAEAGVGLRACHPWFAHIPRCRPFLLDHDTISATVRACGWALILSATVFSEHNGNTGTYTHVHTHTRVHTGEGPNSSHQACPSCWIPTRWAFKVPRWPLRSEITVQTPGHVRKAESAAGGKRVASWSPSCICTDQISDSHCREQVQ